MERKSEQLKEDAKKSLRETIEAAEVAVILGLSTWSVYDLVRKKAIPHIRIGKRRVLFRRSSILRFLTEQEVASTRVEEPEKCKIRQLK
ncbi:DNA binding domain protein, excisionase family [Desulfofarcimen acetoxidans DSM 771]|uniref:DNA binding domain protein, excisionase family n=1 Tax=Desulfofarcimen acetoxidans (strain ATCC 49208 / DSM 771 / KCTC 5769 / VKM B-1644 / 5575) TaxID=485916 RepID=C8VWL0_DESAS|nr:helix-turn-helix domain-containing protein [Desulfofarcimen acetoxidans]ACV64374.1 DNA binding domain protein, excisionase family [Desulfofarcimen acetoxidans DSM 771]